MSTIVYQQQQQPGFQSRHLETLQHVESSWSLSLKLNPPKKQQQQQQIESTPLASSDSCSNTNNTSSGWSSIQSLTPTTTTSLHCKDEVYVHPLTKSSSSKLSDRSLEMCTENLGCETGTDIIHGNNNSSSFLFSSLPTPSSYNLEGSASSSSSSSSSSAASSSNYQQVKRSRPSTSETKKSRTKSELPPPLTSMSGSSSLRVRPHRESGRLVMTAVSTSPRTSDIQAERSNGRLTMCLVMDYTEAAARSAVFPYTRTTTTTTDMVNESDLYEVGRDETERCHVRCKEDDDEEDDKTRNQLDQQDDISISISNSKEDEDDDGTTGGDFHVLEEGDKDEEEGRNLVVWNKVEEGRGNDQLQCHQWTSSRCKETGSRGANTSNCCSSSSRRLVNWEAFWVAT